MHERHDRFAHYRRAVLMAEEGLEQVSRHTVADSRTGMPVTRYLFLGEEFETLNEAETARRLRAVAIAREFYAELDGRTIVDGSEPSRPPAAPAALPGPERETMPPRPS